MNHGHTTYSAVLGTLLSSERKRLNMDQSDVAEKLGLSQASYSRLEGGNAAISVDQMFQAAHALGISQIDFNEKLNNTIDNLIANGVAVMYTQRGNSRGAKEKEDNSTTSSNTGALLVGAGLGALLISIFSNK